MGRAPREFISGAAYHLYARGSNRQAIFRFDADRLDFLECLSRVVERHRICCLGYCLMSNHYHMVVINTADGRLSAAMKELNGRYALRFNKRYGRDAHLFRNRFGAVLQETEEQFFATIRYVARNPVDKGLCAQPDEWPWSSHRAVVGLHKAPTYLALDALLAFFGDTSVLAMTRYRELVKGW